MYWSSSRLASDGFNGCYDFPPHMLLYSEIQLKYLGFSSVPTNGQRFYELEWSLDFPVTLLLVLKFSLHVWRNSRFLFLWNRQCVGVSLRWNLSCICLPTLRERIACLFELYWTSWHFAPDKEHTRVKHYQSKKSNRHYASVLVHRRWSSVEGIGGIRI